MPHTIIMKLAKITSIALLVALGYNTASAQMVRNRSVHFNRHRVTHHHNHTKVK
ncbi:hypothetical protein [Mucilaginibacter jinjuensis]|uniref:Uncharacterized protein n=1 Tax=Mucilaginibacter jinjuensis TaxID=1176721 RepID=A0ABY7TBQ4_9SPHI|nr:hypothetical protein [Mucilaginibacter jinjuensis]WCT12652.1 hypothetical protein PQO05_01745 [Mucilaginibacter jinjuensis]